MGENNWQSHNGGLDPHTTLLRNIRTLSRIMEELEAAGYEDFAREISSLRSDLLAVAGMSSGYDSRDPEAVKRDLYENGGQRILGLIEQAGRIS